MTKFSAQGPMLGYMYQVRYALYILLKSEDNYSLKIEGLDDITFESDGDPKELLQTKHRAKGTTLSDTSTDFWKTIRIWSEYIKSGVISLNENILLTLVTTAEIKPENTLANLLLPIESNNRDEKQALSIMEDIARNNSNKNNKKSYEAFLKLNQKQRQVLISFIIIIDSEVRIENLNEKFKKLLLLSSRVEFLEDVIERIEGWWFNLTVLHLKDNSEKPISKELVLSKLHDIRDEYNKENLPIYDYEFEIDTHELEKDQRIFVEQLRLISLTDRNIRKAINDYMKAYYHRSRWVRKELLLDEELKKYEDKLVNEWERLFDNMIEDIELLSQKSNLTYIEYGRTLYRSIQALEIHIRERAQDAFIMRGSYQILANELRVGWHQDFEKTLKDILAKAVGE